MLPAATAAPGMTADKSPEKGCLESPDLGASGKEG